MNGTVEQSVLEVSTRRRLAMMEQYSAPGEGGRELKRSRTPDEEEEVEVGGSAKRQNILSSDKEGVEQGGPPALGARSPKRKRNDDSGDGEGRPKKRPPAPLPQTPISTERQLDLANSQELQKGSGRLVEKSPGGGELVGNEDLWACLFGVGKEGLYEKKVGDVVRRELMAGAAEKRAAGMIAT